MELSLRLKTIADMVTEGHSVVDVGCDHGYLPIYLVKQGRSYHALASDINQGPLAAAASNIVLYGLDESVIETRLSDGLSEIRPGEGDCLVVAGLGGALMVSILKSNPDTLASFKELVLSPQSEIYLVRKFLEDDGFFIDDEAFIIDEGKYYTVIHALPSEGECKTVSAPMTEEELHFGPCLIKKKDDHLKEYLLSRYADRKEILDKLENCGRDPDRTRKRIRELRDETDMIRTALERMDQL